MSNLNRVYRPKGVTVKNKGEGKAMGIAHNEQGYTAKEINCRCARYLNLKCHQCHIMKFEDRQALL